MKVHKEWLGNEIKLQVDVSNLCQNLTIWRESNVYFLCMLRI